MEDIVASVAEQKIREAMRNGEFDDLPGKGKPLQLADLSHIPEEYRAAYIILKNAGILPEELQMGKEIEVLEALVKSCDDEGERKILQKQLSEKTLRLNVIMEKRHVSSRVLNQYGSKLFNRLR